MQRTAIGLVLTLGLAGCASSLPLIERDASETKAAKTVRVFAMGAPLPHRLQRLVPIEAYACKPHLADAAPIEADALRQLRSKADRVGGNAIVDLAYETRGIETLGSDCTETVTASGVAARLGR